MSDETNDQPKCTMSGTAPTPEEDEEREDAQSMPMLSRDDILGCDDRRMESVAVPEWGGAVFVRVLGGDEGQRFEESATKDDGNIDGASFLAGLVAASVCDDEGRTLFTAADVEALKLKSFAALKRVFAASSKLNGYTKKDVDEALKN